jgi:hypothetical protein
MGAGTPGSIGYGSVAHGVKNLKYYSSKSNGYPPAQRGDKAKSAVLAEETGTEKDI